MYNIAKIRLATRKSLGGNPAIKNGNGSILRYEDDYG